MVERGIEHAFERQKDVFRRHFPAERIDLVDSTQLPDPAVEYFERKSRMFKFDDYHPNDFERYLRIIYESGDKTYVAQQAVTYDTNGETEALTYLVDVDAQHEYLGHGEIRNNISSEQPYFKDKPFVGFTNTKSSEQRKGLGLRRLLIMNALTEMMYGLPLHSGDPSESATTVWRKLESEGKAKNFRVKNPYSGKNVDRHVFVSGEE